MRYLKASIYALGGAVLGFCACPDNNARMHTPDQLYTNGAQLLFYNACSQPVSKSLRIWRICSKDGAGSTIARLFRFQCATVFQVGLADDRARNLCSNLATNVSRFVTVNKLVRIQDQRVVEEIQGLDL